MGAMICLGQGGLRSLSASDIVFVVFHIIVRTFILNILFKSDTETAHPAFELTEVLAAAPRS